MKKATKEQIAIWKEKYGEVYEVNVEGKIGYLKKPDRKTVSYATTIGATDPMKFNEILVENCWIDGDTDLKTKDEYFFGVVGVMQELVQMKEAELKKL